VAGVSSGADLLVVLFSIGVVGGVILVSAYLLSLPFEGTRVVVKRVSGREILRGESPTLIGVFISFFAGVATVVWAGDDLDPNAEDRLGFWHWYGVGTILVLLIVGGSASAAWHAKRHKRCPDCANSVRVEARKCMYCHYRFSPLNGP
jgi:hypothetical protein